MLPLLPSQKNLICKHTDWTLLSAGSVYNSTSSGGRDGLINMVHSTSFSRLGAPNPTVYTVYDTGGSEGGDASPAMGAVYSLLALRYVRLSNLFSACEQVLTV